jgi:hypothetical protein
VEVWVVAGEDFLFYLVESLWIKQIINDVFIASLGVPFEFRSIRAKPRSP